MLSRPHVVLAGLTLAGLFTFPAMAPALESPWIDAGKAQVRLLAASPSRAGVEIRLVPDWHTYWRYPGDAGIPPRFDWSGSRNVASVEVHWPAPERIKVEGGIESIGYARDVTFPLQVRAADPHKPVALRLKLDFGVCEKICIPASARLAIDLPADLKVDQPELDAAEARLPAAAPLGDRNGLGVISAKLERGKQPHALVEVAVPAGMPFDLFAEGPSDEWVLPLPERLTATDGRAHFAIPIDGAPAGGSPIPSKLRLTLVAGDKSIEVMAPLD